MRPPTTATTTHQQRKDTIMNPFQSPPRPSTPSAWAPPSSPPPVVSASDQRSRSGTAAKVLGTIAVLASALGLVTVSSLALFTDSAQSGPNTFSTGTVDISTNPANAAFSPGAMAPGDEVVAPITVTNGGSLDLRYAVTSTTTEDALAAQLRLTVRVGVADCTVANWDASGTEIRPAGVLGTTSGSGLIGNAATGNQAGDRTLSSGVSETLCLHVELPITTGNSFQGQTTTATFDFAAEQTRNN